MRNGRDLKQSQEGDEGNGAISTRNGQQDGTLQPVQLLGSTLKMPNPLRPNHAVMIQVRKEDREVNDDRMPKSR